MNVQHIQYLDESVLGYQGCVEPFPLCEAELKVPDEFIVPLC